MFASTAERSYEAAFDRKLSNEAGNEARSRTWLSSILPRKRHIRPQAQMSYPGCLLGRTMCRGWLACLGVGWLCGNAVQAGVARRSASRLADDTGGEAMVFCPLCWHRARTQFWGRGLEPNSFLLGLVLGPMVTKGVTPRTTKTQLSYASF